MPARIVRKLRRYGLALGLAALVGGLVLFAVTRGPLAPVAVRTAPAVERDLAPQVFGLGTVEARREYAVGPTHPGRVLRMHVDHGDRVAAGQVLAEIDPVDLGERAAAVQAAAERARLAITVAEAQLREARSREELALANVARYRALARTNFVSTEAVQARQSEANVAHAGVEAAAAGLAAALRDAERAKREQAAAAKQLASLRLVSPADAVVVAREAEPGSAVAAGQAVLRLVAPESLWVRARVDQARAGAVAVGQRADIVLRSRPHERFAGRVARIEIVGDAVTEERIVGVEFVAPPATLALRELAEVTIRPAPVRGALAVPTAAVRLVDGVPGVWRIADGRAQFQPIAVGARTLDGFTEVHEGLARGDAVIVHSDAQLAAEQRVRARSGA